METIEELKKKIFCIDMRINSLREELEIRVKDITRLYKYKNKLEKELKIKDLKE